MEELHSTTQLGKATLKFADYSLIMEFILVVVTNMETLLFITQGSNLTV